MKIGRYFIIREDELLHIKQAADLAGRLTLNEIDLILAGKKHLHLNPGKRKVVELPEPIPAEVQRIYNEAIAEADARSTYPVTGE